MIVKMQECKKKVFEGNPATVIPLENWLPDKTMQNIALENNLSETSLPVPLTRIAIFPAPSGAYSLSNYKW